MIQRAIFFRAFDLEAFAGVQYLLARYPGGRSVPGIFCFGVFPLAGHPPRPPCRRQRRRGPRGASAGSGAERRPPLGDGSARRARSCARARPSERGWAASHSAASRASGGQKGAGKRDLRKARAGGVGGERFLIFPEIKQKTELLMSVNSEKSSSPERYGRIPVRMNAGLLPLPPRGCRHCPPAACWISHRAHPAALLVELGALWPRLGCRAVPRARRLQRAVVRGWRRPRARHRSDPAAPRAPRAPAPALGQQTQLGQAFRALLCGKGSVLWKVAQESQIPLLVTFCKIDVIPVQVCARKWSSRCMQ